MTWSYSGDPLTSTRDEVRFLVQDTDTTDQLLSNEEIDYTLNRASNDVYQAAHDCCYVVSAKFARLADTSKSVGDLSLSLSYGNRAQEYRHLGDSILELAHFRTPPSPVVNQEALQRTGNRTSTPTTDFYMGMFDDRSF